MRDEVASPRAAIARLTRIHGSCWMPTRLYHQHQQRDHRDRRRAFPAGTIPLAPPLRPSLMTPPIAIARTAPTAITTRAAPAASSPPPPATTTATPIPLQKDNNMAPAPAPAPAPDPASGRGRRHPHAVGSRHWTNTTTSISGTAARRQRQRELEEEVVRLRALKEEMERQVRQSRMELQRVARFAFCLEHTRIRAMQITKRNASSLALRLDTATESELHPMEHKSTTRRLA